MDHDSIFRGLLDLGYDDCSFFTVVLVEGGEFCKGVFADDIGVQDEEGRVVFPKNLFCKLKGTCGAEGLGFDREGDFDVES